MDSSCFSGLKFDAPLAGFDGDEWNEFHDLQSVADFENCNDEDGGTCCGYSKHQFENKSLTCGRSEQDKSRSQKDKSSCSSSSEQNNSRPEIDKSSSSGSSNIADNFNETFSGSLEDLVNTFDEKVTKCFRSYDEQVEMFAPVQVRNEDEVVQGCQ